MRIQPVADFVISLLREKLPNNLYYHDVAHTLDVVNSAKLYCDLEVISKEDELLIVTAAYFHDVGFIVKYEGNEREAARIAREKLPQMGFSSAQIDIVEKSILATMLPQKADSIYEKIVCDADLDYLGRDDYFSIAEKLRKEWKAYNLIDDSLVKWNEIQFEFLSAHSYFTDSAIRLRGESKLKHIVQVKDKLKALKQNV